jgi:hypothetical protein
MPARSPIWLHCRGEKKKAPAEDGDKAEDEGREGDVPEMVAEERS